MISINDVDESARKLGASVRSLRIARGDRQTIFAQRIGVSVPTLRRLERGDQTVQLGAWLRALWVLDKLAGVTAAAIPQATLFDRIERPVRQRVRTPRSST